MTILAGVKPAMVRLVQLIFTSETTKAMNREWHDGHFACFQCDTALKGCRYVIRDSNAYCPSCYEALFCHRCDACKELIGVGGRVRPNTVLLNILFHIGTVLSSRLVVKL